MFASDHPHGDFLLVTPRLACRRFVPDDRAVFSRMYTDPEIMRQLADGVPFTPRQVTERYTRIKEHYRRQGFGMWALVDRQSNKVIGRAGLQHLSEVDEIEVGYALFPEYWRKGYATEIVTALVSYGFERLNFPRIVAPVRADNLASIRVLEKIGLHAERTLENAHCTLLLFVADRATWQHPQTVPTLPVAHW